MGKHILNESRKKAHKALWVEDWEPVATWKWHASLCDEGRSPEHIVHRGDKGGERGNERKRKKNP
jgi:hypothetical protein